LSPPHTSQVVAVQELSPPEAQPFTPLAAPPSVASLPAVTAAQPLDFAALAAAQLSNPDVASMRASTALSIVSKPMVEHQLLKDISTGEFRPLLPLQFCAAAFHSLHNIAHPGIRASCRLVSSRFCWPHLSKQAAALPRACLYCQCSKVHKHVHLQPGQIEVPRRRFAHIHVDLVGPLPRSVRYSYLLTVLDRIGTPICHGSCSVSDLPGGGTQHFLLQKQSSELSQKRQPYAEVSLNILTDAWDYRLTVVLSPIKV
jgi:hypothetical protein